MSTFSDQDIDFDIYLKDHPDHAKILPAVFYSELVKDYFYGDMSRSGVTLPWSKTHNQVKLLPGNVTLWAGINGHGKSTLLGNVMLSLLTQDQTVCIASPEMPPHVTMAKLTRQAALTNRPSEKFIDYFHDWTDPKLWLYDQHETVKPERMIAVLRYCAHGIIQGKKIRIQHFVIDSLVKCGIKTDDFNRQKDFVDELCAIGKQTGIHIHLVHHIRKGISESSIPGKWDIKGAGEITDLVDNVFIPWRNKPKEEELKKRNPNPEALNEPDTMLVCCKQRHGEWEGNIALWFDPASLQFTGTADKRLIPYLDYSDVSPIQNKA